MASYILSKKGRIVNREAGYDYSKGDVITAEEFKKVAKAQKVFFTEADETEKEDTSTKMNDVPLEKYKATLEELVSKNAEIKKLKAELAKLQKSEVKAEAPAEEKEIVKK
jgi:lipopolysaccharide export LptBFGC system permease protein LptF